MDAARPLWTTSWIGLGAGLLFLVLGLLLDPMWFRVHGAVMVFGVLLPLLSWLHLLSLEHFVGGIRRSTAQRTATLWLVGAALTALPRYAGTVHLYGRILSATGLLVLGLGAILLTRDILHALPRGSVVDEARDPLTKGDDACWKHVRFAHFFLPAGLVLLGLAAVPGIGGTGWGLAGTHLLLVGYGLLSVYGLGHLWVPRFSGVPAIAAGAIKGELYTTLLGLVGLLLGFLTGLRGFLVGLGPFVFLGFFTYMGVLGANIMRNKSRTQRVTPEFVYVPWTFAGVFWLVSGVLMGIFLNAVPEVLADKAPALRWLHIHINLWGGVLLLWLGWSTRLWSMDRIPPRFAGGMKGSFYLQNAALVVAALGRLGSGGGTTAMWVAVGLTGAGLGLYLRAMAGFMKPSVPPGRP